MLCLQSVVCDSTSWVADYRNVRSDQDTTDFTDLRSTDPEVCFAPLQGTENTDIQITDGRTFYDVQITEVQMVDYRCTDGYAVKCATRYAL